MHVHEPDALVVNFAALQAASGHIQNAISTLESQLSQLERDATPLVQTWAGDAREAYQTRQAIWRQASAELAAMLRDIRRALDESAADYAETERRNANLFS
jgi:WXG100 family type VII secretion target